MELRLLPSHFPQVSQKTSRDVADSLQKEKYLNMTYLSLFLGLSCDNGFIITWMLYQIFIFFINVSKIKIPLIHPLYLNPTGWTNWPINEFHVCNLNWQSFPCHTSTYILYPLLWWNASLELIYILLFPSLNLHNIFNSVPFILVQHFLQPPFLYYMN